MPTNPKVLAIVPARGGSKRLPRKNVADLGGKPLIDWTIEAALQSKIPTKILVSSDDNEILQVADRFHSITALKRPTNLATDTATTAAVIAHALEEEASIGNLYDTIIILQPTSPLRSGDDIEKAYKRYISGTGETVVTICEVDHPMEFCGPITSSGHFDCPAMKNQKRSQNYPMHYRLNGAIYILSENFFKKNLSLFTSSVAGSIMPQERSVDIDSHLDFIYCTSLINNL